MSTHLHIRGREDQGVLQHFFQECVEWFQKYSVISRRFRSQHCLIAGSWRERPHLRWRLRAATEIMTLEATAGSMATESTQVLTSDT